MARASSSSTKFASVNLNKSYGKPAAPQGAQLPGSGSSRSRIATHGGMLLLTRPVRSQPAAAAAVQKGAKLTVPLPVNLPSLRREHAGNDPNIALVGATGASGWPKQQQQKEAEEVVVSPGPVLGESNAVIVQRPTPALSAGSTWGTSQPPPPAGQAVGNPPAQFAPVNGELRPSSSPQMVARSGVYTPPRARTVQVVVNVVLPPSRPAVVEKAVVLRGEDFPTLQAALPSPAPPPQHRQKELQQKQREKQQELKDQHQKLQLLSQKQPGDEPLQPQVVVPVLQPSQPVSLQPKREQPPQNLANESGLSLEPQSGGQTGNRPGFRPEGFASYGPPPLVRLNQRSNWTDDEREPAQSLRPQGVQGQYLEWPDRPDRDHFLEDPRRNSRGDEYGFGRQSSQRENPSSFGAGREGGREGGFGKDVDLGRESGFGADGGYAREGNLNSSYNLPNIHSREERFGREGIGMREGFPGREGEYGVEKGGHGKDGGYNRESGMGREGGFGREGGYGRQGTFGRDGGGAGREFVPVRDNNLDRDGFGRPPVGGGSRDFSSDREGFSFRDGFGKETGPREGFYRDASYGRDNNFNRDSAYGRDNRRAHSGDYEGGRGRPGERFGRGGGGRFNAGSEFGGQKGPFASGRGAMGLDSGLDFNRERRYGMPYSEDAFARDFPDLPGLDFRASSGLGEALTGIESKLIRRKKEEAKVSAFYDSQREAFEAELERVQKLQEQERLRKLEEKERAVEQARKEQEEQERLAREEAERLLRLEQEAKDAAARAEQEALEAARKAEEEKKAREEEKRSMLLEEERRKENARRKLLELEERIAKREAERKQKEEEALLPEEDRLRLQRQSQEYESAFRREVSAGEEDERMVSNPAGADQDDDDRAPLRPSRRPPSPLVPKSSQEEFTSRIKSPDLQSNLPAGRRMPDLRGGNAFEADRSRSLMPWRRDFMDNGMVSSQTSLYGREEASELQFSNPSRDRMYPGRSYSERDAFYGGSSSALTSDLGLGEFPARKDRVQGYQERRWQADETGPSNRRSSSPRPDTPDSDGGYLENPLDRDAHRHWGRDKIDRQRLREGKRPSPPPPASYVQGPDAALESTSYGRLRQSLAKQPRVPPPPLRAPMHRPALKTARDLPNSFPSPLLHPVSDEMRGPPWPQDGELENHSIYQNRSLSTSHPSDSSVASSKHSELVQRETSSSHSGRSPVRDSQGLSSSLRPQRSYLQSARGGQSESQDEASEQQLAAVEKETSSSREDSSLPAPTSESHEELDGEDSDEDLSQSTQRAGEGKSEEDEAEYAEDEEEDDGEENVVGLDDEVEGDDENDLADEADLDEEVDIDEGDLDDDEVAGRWDDDVELSVADNQRIEEAGAGDFVGEYDSGPLQDKEDREREMEYKEFEESLEQRDADVSGFKHEYDGEEFKGTSAEQLLDLRQQEQDLSHQGMAQPFLHHVALSPSVALTSVVPLQSAQVESYVSQVHQPLSFMALSLPQSQATSASSQVPSLVASLPVLQNSQEGPMTLQFGLVPSTSLLPASVPAIQIGSIQMPLHLHPQSGPHGSQAPLFQFGQLGHQTPSPSFGHSPNVSQSLVHNGTLGPEPEVSDSQREELFASQASVQLSNSTWGSQLGQNALGDAKSTDADANEIRNGGRSGFRPERRGRERGGRDPVSAPHVKALQRVGSEGALESSSSENSVLAPPDSSSYDNNHGGDSSWQRPYLGGRGRGNSARWPGPSLRGRGRSGSYGGRGVLLDGSTVSAEAGIDVGPVRTRPSRRSSYRRAEFKVRDSALSSERSFPDSLASAKEATGREKHVNPSGWTDASVALGNVSDGHLDLSSQYPDRKYYGEPGQSFLLAGGRSAHSTASKVERSGSNEAALRNGGLGSGFGTGRPAEGVLGKYSAEMASDSPVLDQSGLEAPSEEDDFIEVRSKRQMLNDRREQKEKEMKAKTKDMKAKEHAARKQRPPPKAGFHVDSGIATGSKSSGLVGPEKRSSTQCAPLDANNSSSSRVNQSTIPPPVVPSASLSGSNTPAQLLPPIGTPSGVSADMAYDKRSMNTKSRANSTSAGNVVEGDVSANSAYDNQDGSSGATLAWGGTRSTLQVVSLTQIQLEEAMKPVRFEASVQQQIAFGERSSLVPEPVASVSSAAGKDKPSVSPSGPVGSLLAGEKIQFGAVTSPSIPLPSSRPLTPGLNAVVGSSLGPRADGMSDVSELKSKSKRLSGTGNEVSPFTGKTKRTRGDDERGGDGMDAEAEAAASAVAVAAISSDESVGSTHHGDGQSMPIRGVGLSGQGNTTTFGKSSVTSLHSEYWPAETGISMGDSSVSSVMIQGSGLDESISVSLPADLSVEPTSISIQGPVANSSGLLLPSPGGPLPYRGLEMGTMLGGPMFGFGPSKDGSQGTQGSLSGSTHDQGISSAGSSSGGWKSQHSGGVDSYYAGPPSGYAGPFINPPGGIPSIQGPPHMLVYTSPFASVSQFGQLGVGFMGAQQYLPSGKQPDWKHTPVTTAGPGVVGMNGGESGGGLGGIISAQRSSGVTNNVQRMAPGPSVISTPGPFDLNMSAPFQIPGVEVPIQSQWSHVPGSALHTVPISGPLMGFTMQSRHSRPAHIGHLPHMMETTSGFNLVPASHPVSSGLFQSVDPAAQFPDELGLGDSSSSVTNASSPFRAQRPSSRVSPPVSNCIVPPSGAAGAGVNNNKLRSGRRASRVARGSSSLGGGGIGGSNLSSVGMGPTSGASAQVANGSRAPSPHLQSPSQMPQISLGQHSHPNPYSDQNRTAQQGLPRVGISGGVWSSQGRKGGGPGRLPVSERGSSGAGDKNFVSSSSKLKQVYVVKPSSSPRRNISDAPSNLFSGSEVGQTAVGH